MVRKNMFEPSVLVNYLEISDIKWLQKGIKDNENNKEINIKKFFKYFNNFKSIKFKKKKFNNYWILYL